MIYLELFLTFLKVGALSFGGGFGMIALIRESVVSSGWMTEAEFLNFVAVSESTPGPIAVNIATFVGSHQGGILGAALATLGVVLPSFFIILVIVSLISNLLKFRAVEAFLSGVRPCIVALILSTVITLALSTLFSFSKIGDSFAPDIKGIVILGILFAVHFVYQKLTNKKPSLILMILLSAVMGILLYK